MPPDPTTQDASTADVATLPRRRLPLVVVIALWVVGGVAVGLTLRAVLEAAGVGQPPTRVDPGVPVACSDTEGEFDTLVVHFEPELLPAVAPTYRAMFEAIAPDVRVLVAVATLENFELFEAALADWDTPHPERFEPMVIGREISTWSRDRFTLAREPAGDRRWVCLVSHKPQNLYSRRANDARVPWVIADKTRDVVTRELPIAFDGGDLIISGNTIFVTRYCFMRNRDQQTRTPEAFIAALERHFGGAIDDDDDGDSDDDESRRRLEVVYLDPGEDELTPEHHVGMFLTPIPGTPDALPALVRDDSIDDADSAAPWRFRSVPVDGDLGRGVVAVGSVEAAIYALIEAWDLPLDASRPPDELWEAVQEAAREHGCVGADLSPARRARFTAIADCLREQGFTVAPMPLVPLDGQQYITYNNVVTEIRGGGGCLEPGTEGPAIPSIAAAVRHAYVPQFAGAFPFGEEPLDVAALDAIGLDAWRAFGYETHPIPCSRIFGLGGSVRCLFHVLRWR